MSTLTACALMVHRGESNRMCWQHFGVKIQELAELFWKRALNDEYLNPKEDPNKYFMVSNAIDFLQNHIGKHGGWTPFDPGPFWSPIVQISNGMVLMEGYILLDDLLAWRATEHASS